MGKVLKSKTTKAIRNEPKEWANKIGINLSSHALLGNDLQDDVLREAIINIEKGADGSRADKHLS